MAFCYSMNYATFGWWIIATANRSTRLYRKPSLSLTRAVQMSEGWGRVEGGGSPGYIPPVSERLWRSNGRQILLRKMFQPAYVSINLVLWLLIFRILAVDGRFRRQSTQNVTKCVDQNSSELTRRCTAHVTCVLTDSRHQRYLACSDAHVAFWSTHTEMSDNAKSIIIPASCWQSCA